MKQHRRLALRRETLTQLSGDDLRGIGAAAADVLPTTPVKECVLGDSNLVCTQNCYTRGTTCAC